MRRAPLILLALLALPLACARVQSPPGGEVDQTPASLMTSWPADGSTGAGALSNLVLTFSEPVDRQSVLEHLETDPPWLLRSVRWDADTLLSLRFWEPFPADTSVALFLRPGWRDRHRVEQREWQIINFATGSKLSPGWLAGQATFKGNPSRFMRVELSDSTGALRREQRPDGQGHFAFRQLPVDGRRWRLVAWHDANDDSLFDPAVDFSDSLADSLLVLDAARARRLDLVINVIDPREPGEIRGRFESADTLPGGFLLRFLADSLRVPGDSIAAGADPLRLPDSLLSRLRGPATEPRLWSAEGGDYSLAGVPPGAWWLFAHHDLTGDSLWDPASEPAYLDPGPRRLAPGGSLDWPRFVVPAFPDSASAPPPRKSP